jgi:hypothetical protein
MLLVAGFCEYGFDPKVEFHYDICGFRSGDDSGCGLTYNIL